jgi:DNA-binding NtrC family response regulator
LRDRIEEIPFLIERLLRQTDKELVAHASLVEACMLRRWPGNVRELLGEVKDAAFEAQSRGKNVVRASHLAEDAGLDYLPSESQRSPSSRTSPFPTREAIEQALADCAGKVATAARELGLHRNQLRRWLDKSGVDPKQFGPESEKS